MSDEKGLRFRPLVAGKTSHLVHAVLWVLMSTLANIVFSFNITVPMQLMARSCNVIGSVVVGWLAFNATYSPKQLGCACVVTLGILLASVGDMTSVQNQVLCTDCSQVIDAKLVDGELHKWYAGLFILFIVQLLQATLGHVQNLFYRRYEQSGAPNELGDEFLFTSHVASLFMVIALRNDIWRSASLAIASPSMSTFLPLPRRLAWVFLNNLTQVLCIKGVFRLAASHSPLTVNITLIVRKFFSIVLSVIWFGNRWTHLHSVAVILIFGGVFGYSYQKKKED